LRKPSIKYIVGNVTYPFSITLPNQFVSFCKNNKIAFTQLNNTIVLEYPNKAGLSTLIKIVNKSDNEAAKIILTAITRSISNG